MDNDSFVTIDDNIHSMIGQNSGQKVTDFLCSAARELYNVNVLDAMLPGVRNLNFGSELSYIDCFLKCVEIRVNFVKILKMKFMKYGFGRFSVCLLVLILRCLFIWQGSVFNIDQEIKYMMLVLLGKR